MNNRVDTSRNKTPWDNIEDVTTLQSFIKNKYNKNYKFKHPELTSSKEYIIINSIEINSCRCCNSLNIIKRGRTKNNIQIYYCKSCKKRFTPTKGTIFENHKISITEWIEFLLNLFNNSSTNLVSKNNKNGINTSIFWLQKVFLVLDGYQDNISLSGNLYIDEIYYKVIKNDILKKQNGKEFKGISYNQYCIGLGYDGKNIIAISEGLGKTSSEKTKKAFIEHIGKNSTLIHDEEKSHNLKIALIYSFGVNDEVDDGLFDENCESTENLDKSDRDFLDNAINDYNRMFGTCYDTSSEKFQNYYKDVSLRMKNKEIDILIVANMFLTGFDEKTLNTLWIDKNLKYHGLIQAFSRTNRILNSVKVFGNIISFRNLEKELDEALSLFGDNESSSIVLLRTYNEYYNGYTDELGKEHRGYSDLVHELINKYPAGKLIRSEKEQKKFIKLYGQILKAINILSAFDEFKNDDILSKRNIENYHSMYLDLYNQYRKLENGEKVDINDDLVFEIELVKQIEVNIDYILNLIKKYHDNNMLDKEILISVDKAIMSSPDLRNKKDLIEQFIQSLNEESDVYKDFETFMNSKKRKN